MEASPAIRKGKSGEAVAVKPTPSKAISKSWTPFAQKLSAVLKNLREDDFLILSRKGTNHFVQFICEGSFGFRMETTSDNYLTKHLSIEEIEVLTELGWLPPTSGSEATPQDNPDGSSNFFQDFEVPINFDAVAELAIRTLIQVLNVSHAGMLQYDAFGSDGNSLPLPELGSKRAISEELNQEQLRHLLLQTVTELTGIDDWAYDDNGNIGGIRYGSVSSYIRLTDDRPYARMFAVLIEDVQDTQKVLERINELNRENVFMHLILDDGAVIALSEVLIAPFITSHVAHALGNFCQISDEINTTLQAEFGKDESITIQTNSPVRH